MEIESETTRSQVHVDKGNCQEGINLAIIGDKRVRP